MCRVLRLQHACAVRLEQQVIVGRDRPELLAIAEVVRGIVEEGRLELCEQLFHGRSQHRIDRVVGRKEMLPRIAQHFGTPQLVAAKEADLLLGLPFPVVPAPAQIAFALI
jgi:hypothetical protein